MRGEQTSEETVYLLGTLSLKKLLEDREAVVHIHHGILLSH